MVGCKELKDAIDACEMGDTSNFGWPACDSPLSAFCAFRHLGYLSRPASLHHFVSFAFPLFSLATASQQWGYVPCAHWEKLGDLVNANPGMSLSSAIGLGGALVTDVGKLCSDIIIVVF